MWEGTVSLRWKVTVLSCCRAVGRSVGRSVVISRKAVSQKGKKRIYSGKSVMRKILVRRKEAEGFYKYRKNAKTLGDFQSTPPHTSLIKNVVP